MNEPKTIIQLRQPEPLGDELFVVQLKVSDLRRVIRDEFAKNGGNTEDRLVDIAEAARILNVSVEWLYHQRKSLPFAKKLGRKLLKFSVNGMNRWIASRGV